MSKIRQNTLALVDAATGTKEEKGGLGVILYQTDNKGHLRVISYANRVLSFREKYYTPFHLKVQAACWGMDHFRMLLSGQKFILSMLWEFSSLVILARVCFHLLKFK
jgi:hypothetical protein